MSEPIRLQKLLSRAGRASRREAERLMQAGRVRVNGEIVTELGTRVVPGRDAVEVDGVPVTPTEVRWVVFHKPAGVLTTRSDPHGGRTIYDVLPSELRDLRYVGRLDRDTEGLLLLTNEGDLAHALQHPSGEVEREYVVEVAGAVPPEVLERLLGGVELEDGWARAHAAALIEAGGSRSRIRLVLMEGRKREVRRMMRSLGYEVVRLTRVRFGAIELGTLPTGAWRPLSDRERTALASLAQAD